MKKSQIKNTKKSSPSQKGNPSIRNNLGGLGNGFNFKHSELCCSIEFKTGDPLLAAVRTINPTDPETFPWLSTLADSFEYYRFRSLSFRYVPRCSQLQSGEVVMAIDYDVSDSAPTHMEDLYVMLSKQMFSVWERATMSADKRSLDLYPYRYLKELGTDHRLEDVGKMYVGLNTTDEKTFGSIFVDYDVDLFSPQFSQPIGISAQGLPAAGNVNWKALVPSSTVDYNYARHCGMSHGADGTKFYPAGPGKYLIDYTSPISTNNSGTRGNVKVLEDLSSMVRSLENVIDITWDFGVGSYINTFKSVIDIAGNCDKGNSYVKLGYDLTPTWQAGLAYAILSIMKVGDSFHLHPLLPPSVVTDVVNEESLSSERIRTVPFATQTSTKSLSQGRDRSNGRL